MFVEGVGVGGYYGVYEVVAVALGLEGSLVERDGLD